MNPSVGDITQIADDSSGVSLASVLIRAETPDAASP